MVHAGLVVAENATRDHSMGAEKQDSALGRKYCGEDRAKSIHQGTNRVEKRQAHTTETERHLAQSIRVYYNEVDVHVVKLQTQPFE